MVWYTGWQATTGVRHVERTGTTSVVLNENGTVHSQARHFPYGEVRWFDGTLPTDYRFTGQRDVGYIKLTIMGARWYDSELGRWISPDTIVPDPTNPQSFNRYSYGYNNPVKFRDPSGHEPEFPMIDGVCSLGACLLPPPEPEPEFTLLWPYLGDLPSGVYDKVGGTDMLNWFGADRGGGRIHEGIDIHTRPQAPFAVIAGTGGRATYYTEGELSGGRVVVDEIPGHPNITVEHMHVESSREHGEIFNVDENTVIGTADEIGNATSPHDHLQVNVGGEPQDPMGYLVYPLGTQFNYTHPSESWLSFHVYVPGMSTREHLAQLVNILR
jgi:RHS repeat-associated protein